MTMGMKHGHPGETLGIALHETDLIHELGQRLGSLWGFDRSIASAGGLPDLLEFWQGAKSREQRNIDQLKQLIQQYVQGNGTLSQGRS